MTVGWEGYLLDRPFKASLFVTKNNEYNTKLTLVQHHLILLGEKTTTYQAELERIKAARNVHIQL